MIEQPRPIRILMADDDEEDRMLTRDALEQSRLANEIDFVVDGEELLDYLRHQGAYANGKGALRPHLILLDLNMPRMDGREALEKIQGDPELALIPVVIMTTSKAEEDICRSYELGASSYIQKPVTFNGLIRAMDTFNEYWFQIVCLPPQ